MISNYRKFLAVVVPIVALCGPFGAFLAPYLHGYVKAFLVFALSTVALVNNTYKQAWKILKLILNVYIGFFSLFNTNEDKLLDSSG